MFEGGTRLHLHDEVEVGVRDKQLQELDDLVVPASRQVQALLFHVVIHQ